MPMRQAAAAVAVATAAEAASATTAPPPPPSMWPPQMASLWTTLAPRAGSALGLAGTPDSPLGEDVVKKLEPDSAEVLEILRQWAVARPCDVTREEVAQVVGEEAHAVAAKPPPADAEIWRWPLDSARGRVMLDLKPWSADPQMKKHSDNVFSPQMVTPASFSLPAQPRWPPKRKGSLGSFPGLSLTLTPPPTKWKREAFEKGETVTRTLTFLRLCRDRLPPQFLLDHDGADGNPDHVTLTIANTADGVKGRIWAEEENRITVKHLEGSFDPCFVKLRASSGDDWPEWFRETDVVDALAEVQRCCCAADFLQVWDLVTLVGSAGSQSDAAAARVAALARVEDFLTDLNDEILTEDSERVLFDDGDEGRDGSASAELSRRIAVAVTTLERMRRG